MPEFNAGTELTYLEKDDILMSGSPTDFSRIKAQNVFNRSLTYAQLETLRAASNLIIGQKYKITDATDANITLIVEAVAVNKIGEVAEAPSNANFAFCKYDFPNDVIIATFAGKVITLGDRTGMGIPSDLGGVSFPVEGTAIYIGWDNKTTDAMYIDATGTPPNATAAGFALRRSRGTLENPIKVEDNDQIGYVDWRAYSGDKYWQMASFSSRVDGEFTDGEAPPSCLIVSTNVAGGPSTDVVKFTRRGQTLMGVLNLPTNAANAMLAITQTIDADYAEFVKGFNQTGGSFGTRYEAGTNGSDGAIFIFNQAGDTLLASIRGDGSIRGESTTGFIKSNRLTTTQRNALTGLEGGEIIFNTTTNKHQGYDGSTWNDMY